MPFFTVFTPTFNRGYILPKLYHSLQNQTFTDFEWLIVDDGSTDGTQEIVGKWKDENNSFSIQYIKKENEGKPRAINVGLNSAQGKYFFIVDSDDQLTTDALEKMNRWCMEIDSEADIVGVGAARGFPDFSYLKGVPPKIGPSGYVDATNLERKYYDLDADMCEAYKLEVFRQFPMAEWPGEIFAPEQISINEIALAGYKVRWHSDIIYICEYLQDGLTRDNKIVFHNPMGYAMMYNHMLRYPTLSKKEKFRAACQHIALSVFGKNFRYIFKSYHMGYTLLAMPFGLILAIRRKMQARSEGV